MKCERPLVIYHGNCVDGFTAAWCFWRKYGENADYVAGVYQQDPPNVVGRDVYLVDFSYKAPVVADMLRAAASVTLIDHHKTALDDLAHLRNGDYDHRALHWFCDLERSGATLAWDYLFPKEPRPLLLEHVEDRDLWRFQIFGTRQISAFLFSHEYSFPLWDKLMRASYGDSIKMMDIGEAIERKHIKDVKELVAVCKRRMVIGGHDVPVASLPYTMVSDAANLMAQGEPFAACYWDTEDGRIFGLRSTEEGVDVSEVAAEYGGGGHVRSAGFKVGRHHVFATL